MQQAPAAAPLEHTDDDDQHDCAQKRDQDAGQVEAVHGIRHLKERFSQKATDQSAGELDSSDPSELVQEVEQFLRDRDEG